MPPPRFVTLCSSAAIATLLIGGCAGAKTPLDPARPFAEVRTSIAGRTAMKVEWPRDEEARAEIQNSVLRILDETPFSVDTAVQVALLNNPHLRAQFEEIGIAHAAVVQAGLMSNPRTSFTAKFPDAAPHRPRLELPFVQNVVEVALIPLRRRVAKDMLMQAMLRTSEAVLQLGESVRIAYYQAAAARRLLEVEQQMLTRTSDAAAHAQDLAEAGRITEVDRRRAQAAKQSQRLRVALAQIDLQVRDESLRELLGLSATQLTWAHEPELPPLPEVEANLAILEIIGLEHRFDVQLARQEVQLIDHAISLTRRSLFPTVNLGITIERDRDRTLLVGPRLALELPVFDQQQGTIVRLQSQARQSRELHEAAVNRALSEIRSARGQYVGARQTAEFYRDVVVPMRGEVTAVAVQEHKAARLGLDDLLLVRDEEFLSQLGAVSALRDYWIARARLERAAACDLNHLGSADVPMSWLDWAPAEFAGPNAMEKPELAEAEEDQSGNDVVAGTLLRPLTINPLLLPKQPD